jgi:glucosamine--fructose-6-phosphate aminotransferase (isomerizing)
LEEALAALSRLPEKMEAVLKEQPAIEALAERYAEARGVLFFARGVNYPVALEGALKLKEISYIHADGMRRGK